MRKVIQFFVGLIVLVCSAGLIVAAINGTKSDTPDGASSPVVASSSGGSTTAAGSNFERGKDGTYIVGAANGVAPGTYQTSSVTSYSCYWARLSGLTGSFDEILANEIVPRGGVATVQVLATDKALKVQGCGKWTLV